MPRFRTMIESWFKYEENINDESIGIHRDSGDCDRQEFRAGSGFFSAPRLQVESITYSETKVEIGSSYNNDYSSVIDPQKFECRLWIIKIHSRNPTFSILKNCIADAYIITAGEQATSHAVRLPWKNLRDPPTMFAPNTSLSNPNREQYRKIFAYYYEEEIRRNYAYDKVDVRKDVTNELYFLLTFKDSVCIFVNNDWLRNIA
jgi:hypothetical protein